MYTWSFIVLLCHKSEYFVVKIQPFKQNDGKLWNVSRPTDCACKILEQKKKNMWWKCYNNDGGCMDGWW